jgi:hypothetical protein
MSLYGDIIKQIGRLKQLGDSSSGDLRNIADSFQGVGHGREEATEMWCVGVGIGIDRRVAEDGVCELSGEKDPIWREDSSGFPNEAGIVLSLWEGLASSKYAESEERLTTMSQDLACTTSTLAFSYLVSSFMISVISNKTLSSG